MAAVPCSCRGGSCVAPSASSGPRRARSVLQGRGSGPRRRSLCMDAKRRAGCGRARFLQTAGLRSSGEGSRCGSCALGRAPRVFGALRQASTQTGSVMWDAGGGVGRRRGRWESHELEWQTDSLTRGVFSQLHQIFPLRPTLWVQCETFPELRGGAGGLHIRALPPSLGGA